MNEPMLPSIINTTRLRILREVAACGTITGAAKALYMTQPAVSQQIAALEREIGVPLLERTTRSMYLTDAGRRLVSHADVILADCENALAEVRAFSDKIAGTVRMSVFRTAASSVALAALVNLRQKYPELDVRTKMLPPEAAIFELKAGQLDIALTYEWGVAMAEEDAGLDRYPILTEPLVVLLPRGHSLSGGPVRLRDMRGERWCVSQDSTHGSEIIRRIADSIDLKIQVVFESDDFRAIGSAVEAGLGVSLAPALTDLRGLDISVQPLIEPSLRRTVFACVRRGSGLTPTLRVVVEELASLGARASETE